MTITDIITEFGAYYLANRANAQNLRKKLFLSSNTEEHFPIIPCASTQYETAYGVMTRVTQPFKKDWSPIDPLTMKPKTITLRKLKIDVTEFPDTLESSWLAFLARPEANGASGNLDRKTWPFIRWFIEEYLIPQHKEDLVTNEDYFGVYAAPSGGSTPGAVNTIYDGLGKQIADGLTAGVINSVPTGAISGTDTTFVQQMETFANTILSAHPHLNGTPLKLFLNTNLFNRYKRGFRQLYQTAQDFQGLNKQYIIDKNIEVIGLHSMLSNASSTPTPGASSNRVFLTLPQNCNTFVKLPNNQEMFQVESSKRSVDIFTDYYRAIGFQQDRYVYANELA